MKDKSILIRADGGKHLGMGHWSRCLFLVSCIENAKAILFTRYSADFKASFASSPLEVVQIEDDRDFFLIIKPGDIVIVDGYDFEAHHVKMLAQAGALIVYIDDLLKSNIQSDLVINHAPGITSESYISGGAHTAYLLGPSYSLIANDFMTSGRPVEHRIKNVLIAMGGADPDNHTLQVLQKYHDFFAGFERVHIIVGGMYLHLDSLKKYCSQYRGFIILHNLRKSEVAEYMQQCGVAVLSSSTMAMEYAQVTGLLLITQTADNQKLLYNGMVGSGVASDIQTSLNLKTSLEVLLAEMTLRQRTLFDGHSRVRFERVFKELEAQKKLRLRLATVDDADLTLAWATDKVIRAFSFSTHEITREGHLKWFIKKINSDICVYYIVFLEDEPVGSVRFDLDAGNATISYLLDKRYHGEGLGRPMLAEGIKKLLSSHQEIHTIIGYVMDANQASIRIFEKMAFRKDQGYNERPNTIKFFKKLRNEEG